VLIYALAAASLGGLDSPFGAVIGGWVVGLAESITVTYLGFIGPDLGILVPLAVIVVVLMVRPSGLFGHAEAVRV
jgi:branched-chain amino acid transport system permease protein